MKRSIIVTDPDSIDFMDKIFPNRAVSFRPYSPLIVPCVAQLYTMLCEKFVELESNLEKFIERKGVLEITKLLKVFHRNYCNVKLNKTTYFYPCKQCLDSEVSEFHDFTVLSKLYDRDVLCDPCNACNKNIKKIRIV